LAFFFSFGCSLILSTPLPDVLSIHFLKCLPLMPLEALLAQVEPWDHSYWDLHTGVQSWESSPFWYNFVSTSYNTPVTSFDRVTFVVTFPYLFCLFCFETVSHCVARLASNSGLPALAFQVLGLQMCTMMRSIILIFKRIFTSLSFI
jgi:hypothetical protein